MVIVISPSDTVPDVKRLKFETTRNGTGSLPKIDTCFRVFSPQNDPARAAEFPVRRS